MGSDFDVSFVNVIDGPFLFFSFSSLLKKFCSCMFYFRLTAYSLYAAVSVGLQVIFKSEYNHVLIKIYLQS